MLVLEAEKGRLRLGIEAPKGYTIVREELVAEIRDANRQAALSGVEMMGDDFGDLDE